MSLTRRDIIAAGIAAGAGLMTTRLDAHPNHPLRVAHLTDMHVQPERRAGEGYLAALQSLEQLNPRPDLIITGGDHVMDATDETIERSKVQWDIYAKAIAQTGIPVQAVLGNHDIFGWGKPEIPDSTVGYGRAMALDQLRMKQRFYSFDAGGWKFILLDSMSRREKTYLGDLGAEQTEWLKGELESTPKSTPIVIFCHIPILSACVFFDVENPIAKEQTDWRIPDAWMHRDLHALLDLFQPHSVRLLVSGHIHLVDRVDYRNMTFICDGAVSGNWWKGPLQQFAEGYGVIDLWPDGRFEHKYVTYGWKAEKA